MPATNLMLAEEIGLPFEQAEMARVERGQLGRALRAAREGRRMRLEDVEAETRIRLRYLAAIEESRFGEFSRIIYAFGFVRAFARAVGVAEDWAAETLRAELGQQKPR